MDFLAAVLAIVALFMAMKLLKRVTAAELRIAELIRGIQAAPPQTAAPQVPDAPTAAEPVFVAPAAAPPQEQTDHAAIDAIVAGAGVDVNPPPPPPREPEPPAKSFEERFGASWVVWIGGIALALGGIVLVHYSIEAGLIGPGVRIFLGGLLAAALVAAGEWTRRREIAIPL